jgi:hypothetical protein
VFVDINHNDDDSNQRAHRLERSETVHSGEWMSLGVLGARDDVEGIENENYKESGSLAWFASHNSPNK